MRSIGRLQNIMRLQAMLAASGMAQTRFGLITSYDPKNYCAKATLQPGGQETGWLPVKTLWAGNGWGLFMPPPVGSQVEILFQEGSVDVGVIQGLVFSTADAPLNVPAGEAWLVHQSGSFFKLTNDGKLSMNSTAEIDIGNLGQTLHTIVIDTFQALFNGHTHSGVQAGSANSGPPNQQMGSSHLSAILKAN